MRTKYPKDVQDSDGYEQATEEGKIKRTVVRGSLRSQGVVCTLVLDNSVWRLQGAATPLSTRSPLFSGVQTPSLAMCGDRETAALALTQVILRFSTTASFSSCWASFGF